MGYPLFYVDSADKVKDCVMPPRDKILQWLYDLAYTQWSVSEIKNGTMWNHLRPHALKVQDARFDNMLCKF